MKSLLLGVMLILGVCVHAQKTFDDGWDKGYTTACEDYNLNLIIIPISPIVMANESDTYRSGLRRGYKRALEDNNIDESTSLGFGFNTVVIGDSQDEDLDFDDGWEQGYTTACEDYNLNLTIIPISPIVMANESDTYRAGLRRGYKRALEDNNIEESTSLGFGFNTVVIGDSQDEDLDFDDGWDAGYKDAMEDNNNSVFIVPISPIVMANEADTYRAGYNRGYKRALKDLND